MINFGKYCLLPQIIVETGAKLRMETGVKNGSASQNGKDIKMRKIYRYIHILCTVQTQHVHTHTVYSTHTTCTYTYCVQYKHNMYIHTQYVTAV